MKAAFFEIENKDYDGLNFKKALNNKDLKKIKDIEILSTRSKSKINKEVIDALPNLKYILTRTVGIEHIDIEYAKKRGILVSNIPDYCSNSVAEHVFALLLCGVRKIIECNKRVKRGKFSYRGLEDSIILKGKTFGVIGTGKIGEEVIKIAKGFGMKVIAYDIIKKEGIEYVDLDELFRKADIISLHLPLTDSTKHIINKESIKKMKEGVILINNSRGELINTKDLIENKDKFYFIGLDVLENEKEFSKEHELNKLNNVLITPHSAFCARETIENIYEQTIELIDDFIKGKPKNILK